MLESTFYVLNRGLLLRLFYKKQNDIVVFSYIMRGDFYNKIYPEKKANPNIIYDVILGEEFDFKKIKDIQVIEFPFQLPFDNQDKIFDEPHVIFNHEYKDICKEFLDDVFYFIEYEYKRILNIKTNDFYFDRDVFILRLYPTKIPKNKKQMEKIIKKDIYNKFFVASYQDEDYANNESSDALSLIPSFNIFGISKKNENCTDPIFLDALKNKWFELINDAKKDLLLKCEKINSKELTENEKIEFKKEIKELKKELNKINIDILERFKTPKEVVSYWPDILQPIPNYVYCG